MKKITWKKVKTITDGHIKIVEESLSKRKRNNDNMNPLKHVAIIMDGNGRWGLKNKILEMQDINKV